MNFKVRILIIYYIYTYTYLLYIHKKALQYDTLEGISFKTACVDDSNTNQSRIAYINMNDYAYINMNDYKAL